MAGCATSRPMEKEPVNVAVEHILQAIDQAIDTAYARHAEGIGLEITEVSVELQTTIDKTASQDVSLSVIEIDASTEKTFTQSLTVVLDPPKDTPAAPQKISESIHPTLVEDLGKAIEAAILGAHGAKQGLERLHPDGLPLVTQKITTAITFELSTTGEGLPTISIFGIDLTAKRSSQRGHTITMVFKVVDSPSQSPAPTR